MNIKEAYNFQKFNNFKLRNKTNKKEFYLSKKRNSNTNSDILLIHRMPCFNNPMKTEYKNEEDSLNQNKIPEPIFHLPFKKNHLGNYHKNRNIKIPRFYSESPLSRELTH